MYANLEVDSRNHATNFPAMLLDEIVDGVIVVGAFLEETIADISRRTNRNIVLVDGYTSDEVSFDSILIDNMKGAIHALSYR
jgi:LacI family transcriptional regulator